MRELLVSENVLEKAAVFAVGCCSLGVVTASAGAAALLAPGAALVGVLGAIALRTVLKPDSERAKAFRAVKKKMKRKFLTSYEADEAHVAKLQARFSELVNLDDLFSVESLQEAVAEDANVVSSLTTLAVDGLSKRDAMFALEGVARDFARHVFTDAFVLAIKQCPDFRQQATFVVATETLKVARKTEKKLDEVAQRLESLERLGQADIERIATAIMDTTARRRAETAQSIFYVLFDDGSKSWPRHR